MPANKKNIYKETRKYTSNQENTRANKNIYQQTRTCASKQESRFHWELGLSRKYKSLLVQDKCSVMGTLFGIRTEMTKT